MRSKKPLSFWLFTFAAAGLASSCGAAIAQDTNCTVVQIGQTLKLRGSLSLEDVVFNGSQKYPTNFLSFEPPICIDGGSQISKLPVFTGHGSRLPAMAQAEATGTLTNPGPRSIIRDGAQLSNTVAVAVSQASGSTLTVQESLRRRIDVEQRCVRNAKAQIAHEQEVGRVSGVVDKQVLHQAGEMLLVCRAELDRLQRCKPDDDHC